MVSIVEPDAEHLARPRDGRAQHSVGDETAPGSRRASAVEIVELAVANDCFEWISQARVAG
jgi:hypothetical protein